MTRDETLELLAIIKVAYPQQLGKISDIEAGAMVNLWTDTFKRVPKEVMEIAAKNFIRKQKYFPSIADMCEELDTLNKDAQSKIEFGYEVIDDNDDVKIVHYDTETTRKLEFIRQATADFAVVKMMERRADGAKDWLLESIQDKQLRLGGGGMRKSILCDNDIPRCYFCGTAVQLERHHCLFGVQRRKADKFGLWVYLCVEHHRGRFGVHQCHERARELQALAQIRFEEIYGHDRFMAEFKKNYLED